MAAKVRIFFDIHLFFQKYYDTAECLFKKSEGIIREPQQMLYIFAAKKVMANLVRMNEEFDANE